MRSRDVFATTEAAAMTGIFSSPLMIVFCGYLSGAFKLPSSSISAMPNLSVSSLFKTRPTARLMACVIPTLSIIDGPTDEAA